MVNHKPFLIRSHACVGNSGGKTSGYNLWLHLQANGGTLTEVGRCVFTNTGWEHPQTLDFLAEQERRWGWPIMWLEFCRQPATADETKALSDKWADALKRLERVRETPSDKFGKRKGKNELFGWHPDTLKLIACKKAEKYAWLLYCSMKKAELIGMDSFRRVTRDTASTDGRPYQELLEGLLRFRNEVKELPGVLPNGVQRICTGHLKVKTCARFMAAEFGIKRWEFEARLGLRADEEARLKNAREWDNEGGRARFPLDEAGITKEDVAAFWTKQPFRLALKSHEGNCGGCYMKRWSSLVDLIRRDFFDASWWQEWEQRTGQRFREERSCRTLVAAAKQQHDFLDPRERPPDDYDNGITCEGGYCSD